MSVEQGSKSVQYDPNRWTTDEVFQLIDIVKECGAVYNPLDKNYFCRPYVENLWRDIDIRFGKRPGASLSKWTNLRISFRREYQLLIKDKAKPSWMYFSKMLFLQPFLRKKRQHNEKLESHIQEALEQISSITRGNFKNYVAKIEQCNTEQTEPTLVEETLDDDISWNNDTSVKAEEENADADECCLIDDSDPGCEESIDDIYDERNNIEARELSIVDDKDVFHSNENLQEQSIDSDSYAHSTHKRKHDDSLTLSAKRSQLGSAENLKGSETFHSAQLNLSCECKTNPDAMFLMSLMPDIELLSRKDKGKFKIEIQRLIQNLLYPDE